jgi:hypothetical protein
MNENSDMGDWFEILNLQKKKDTKKIALLWIILDILTFRSMGFL